MLPRMRAPLFASLIATLFTLAACAQSAPEKRKGWFGIGLKAADADEQAKLGVDTPVPKVTKVFEDSPAFKAGVQLGDFVLSYEGQGIKDTRDLIGRVGGTAPGSMVKFKIMRAGKPVMLQAVLDLRIDQRDRLLKEWLGKALPNLSLAGVRDSDGKTIELGQKTLGKVVVIDYFATWCGPCKVVMPQLEALQKQYGDNGLLVVGVSGEEPPVIAEFASRRSLAYVVGADTTKTFSRDLMVSVLPTVWIVDRKGVIRQVYFGAGHEDQIEAAVRDALGLSEEVSIEQPSRSPGKVE